MMIFLAIIIALLVGISFSTLLIGLFLSKNNIGDSVGSIHYYSGAPKYDRRIDKGSRYACEQFVAQSHKKLKGNSEKLDLDCEVCSEVYSDSEHDGKVKVTALGKHGASFEKTHVKVQKKESYPEQYNFEEELPPPDKPVFKPLDE